MIVVGFERPIQYSSPRIGGLEYSPCLRTHHIEVVHRAEIVVPIHSINLRTSMETNAWVRNALIWDAHRGTITWIAIDRNWPIDLGGKSELSLLLLLEHQVLPVNEIPLVCNEVGVENVVPSDTRIGIFDQNLGEKLFDDR